MQLLPRLVTSKSSRTTTRFLSLFEATVRSHLAANRVEQRLDLLCLCVFRDSKAIAFSYDRFVIQIFIRQNHFQRHILPKTSNHRAQAVTTTAQQPESWEQSNLPAPRKKLSRFPTQFRRDQTRQQSSAGTARKHRAQAVTTTAQRPENWEQSNLPAPRKKLSRFPTQFRRDQTRQQVSAGTARPEKGG